MHSPSSDLVARLPVMRIRVFTLTLNTLLEFAWARSRLVCAAGTRMSTVHDFRPTQTSAHHATRVWSRWNSGNDVTTMPLHLAHSDSPPTTTLPPAGFIITLTLPCVLMAVSTSPRPWNDCNALELMQRRYLGTRVSVVFLIGFFVTLTHAFVSLVISALSPFLPRRYFALQKKHWKAQFRVSLPHRVLAEVSHTQELLFHEHTGYSVLMNLTWLKIALLSFSSRATRPLGGRQVTAPASSCPFLNALHFLFLASMARRSSVGMISKIPVLNVSIIWHGVIVFV